MDSWWNEVYTFAFVGMCTDGMTKTPWIHLEKIESCRKMSEWSIGGHRFLYGWRYIIDSDFMNFYKIWNPKFAFEIEQLQITFRARKPLQISRILHTYPVSTIELTVIEVNIMRQFTQSSICVEEKKISHLDRHLQHWTQRGEHRRSDNALLDRAVQMIGPLQLEIKTNRH